uniref:Ras-related protein Rab-38 n=1 Tax=Caligus clemensi TaxID=344056 RepID=C1C0V6_CALCM|nr:Ras-related protein Rab-38 [Caligus clemensi]
MFLFRRSSYGISSESRLYKVLVIGDVNAGKSAYIRRYTGGNFSEDYLATVGVDFHLKVLHLLRGLEIRLQLWDIAGQERFSKMTRAYFKGSVGALIMYDSTNLGSFRAVQKWKKELDATCSLPEGQNIPAMLISTKNDLPPCENIPQGSEMSDFLEENGFIPRWFQTSSKTGEYVQESIDFMIKLILRIDSWSAPFNFSSAFEGCHGSYKELMPPEDATEEGEGAKALIPVGALSAPASTSRSSQKKVVFYNCSDCEEEDRPKDAHEVVVRKMALRNYMKRTEMRRGELLNIRDDEGSGFIAQFRRQSRKHCNC